MCLFAIPSVIMAGPTKQVAGNRKQQTITKDVHDFKILWVKNLNKNFNVHFIQGAKSIIRVVGDANIVSAIDTLYESYSPLGVETLRIFADESTNFAPSKPIEIYITNPVLRQVQVDGDASFTTDGVVKCADILFAFRIGKGNMNMNVNGPALKYMAPYEGEAIFKGEVTKVEVFTFDGTSRFNGAQLKAKRVGVMTEGKGQIIVNASDLFVVNDSSVSKVKNVGTAKAQPGFDWSYQL